MSNLKWADVAHYYLASEIELSGGFYIREYNLNTPLKTWRIDRDVPERDSGIYFDDWKFMEPSGIKPILRHLEDMTEGEAREIATIDGWESYPPGSENHHIQDFFFSGRTLYVNQFKNDHMIDLDESRPEIFHWLISKGFDVFGLIESGQAIRKGVEGA